METADIPMTQDSSHVEMTNEGKLITFFNVKDIVHYEFTPQGQVFRGRPGLILFHFWQEYSFSDNFQEVQYRRENMNRKQ
jgi:hypothetical protein